MRFVIITDIKKIRVFILLVLLIFPCFAKSNYSVRQILSKQNEINNNIDLIAKENNLYIDTYEHKSLPIYDGVGNPQLFINTRYKVMWILKEAYEDEDEDGNPYGGGWSVVDINAGPYTSSSNPTFKNISYVTYGIFHKQYDFGKLPKFTCPVRNNKDYSDVMQSIIYINTNKMVALKSSDNNIVRQNFELYWKEIIKKQIDFYKPDIIVFGGTFEIYDTYRNYIFGNLKEINIKKLSYEKQPVRKAYLDTKGTLLIDAWHPNFYGSSELYFANIINCVKTWEKMKNR